jgi:hypothetical protein
MSLRHVHLRANFPPEAQLTLSVIVRRAISTVMLQTVQIGPLTSEGRVRFGFAAPHATLHTFFILQPGAPRGLRFEGYSPPF